MGEREGKPLYYADSVYTLRSNSPPARRVLSYPIDKTRLREGTNYIAHRARGFDEKKRINTKKETGHDERAPPLGD